MADAFFHGVRTRQIPTALVPPREVDSALPVVFGCAPIHRLAPEVQAKAKPGQILLIYDDTEAGQQLGISWKYDDFQKWSLSGFSYAYFALYQAAPIVFANLFDPSKHYDTVSAEAVQLTGGRGLLAHNDIIPGTAVVLPDGGGLALTPGVDFALNNVTGEIQLLPDGSVLDVNSILTVSYQFADPGQVTADDVIGGYDIVTGETTGMSLVDEVFTRFRKVPGIILAPGYSENVAVAAVGSAKAGNINDVFRAVFFADIPSDGPSAVKLYSEVAEYKQRNSLVSEDLVLFWPKVQLDGETLPLSTHAAGICADTDENFGGGIPYFSPSNKRLAISGCVADGKEIWLSLPKLNNLNSNGIVTASNFDNGWRLWGNHTAAFPSNTDPKDSFIPIRRMFAWYGNRLVLTWWQRVDWPITRRLIQTIVNSEQITLNTWQARGVILGGEIAFREQDNSILDLMSGKIAFHVALGFSPPAEQMEFLLEYEPQYLANLFG